MADFKTKGFKELAKKLDRLKGKIKDRAKKSIVIAALNTRTLATKLIRDQRAVRTGRLLGSIRFTIRNDGLTGEVFTDVKYAAFIEFGTVHMPARPFLFPAFQQAQARFIEDMKRL